MAIDIPNLTRFIAVKPGARGFLSRNRAVFLGQLVALPVTQALVAGIGGVSFIATGNWNPIEVIQGDAQGLSLLTLLLLVVLAQWSTNNSANLIPAALTFVNLAPRRIDYRIGVALAGVVGTLCFPWEILNNLFTFLGYCGAFLLSIGGIMVADYYVLRGRRVNVPALYDPQGQYRYAGGFNPAGLVAWIVAGAAAAWWSDYSVFVGFPLGALLYLALMKLVVLPRHPQPEMAAAEGYLATSEGVSWAYLGGGRFTRLRPGETAGAVVPREDL